MTAEQRLILKYVALACAAFLLGCATALAPQLMDPSQPPLNWRIVFGTGITALVTAYGGSLLPRPGSAGIARQVNDLREQGYHRADMQVVPKRGAEPDLSTVDAPVAHPLTYVVLHGSATGHVAFLTTAAPISGAEMAADQAFHVTDHRPYGTDPPFACDSCEEPLDHVAVVESEWIAISQADATLDALDLPEPGHEGKG